MRYYEKRLETMEMDRALHGSTVMRDTRFKAALKNMELKVPVGSLLDIGCGKADLFFFMNEAGVTPFIYFGVDAVKAFVEQGNKALSEAGLHISKYRVVRRDMQSFLAMESTNTYDFSVALSVFSHRSTSMSETERIFKDVLESIFKLCRVACSVTALSSYKKLPGLEEAVLDPDWGFKFARRLTERVVLDTSYAAHEFMLTLFKEKSEFRKEWERTGGWA